MTTETFRSLTHETVQIYARTAKTIVKTYRAGAKRVLGGVRRRLAHTAGATRIEQPLRNSLVNVGEQLTMLVGTRIDALSSAANGAIDTVAHGSSKALGTFAGAADRFYRSLPSRAAGVFSQVNLPAVRLSRDLAVQISRGADSVAKRVGAEHGKGTGAKATVSRARRPARKASVPAAKATKRARKT
jgi:hypothetical protein